MDGIKELNIEKFARISLPKISNDFTKIIKDNRIDFITSKHNNLKALIENLKNKNKEGKFRNTIKYL